MSKLIQEETGLFAFTTSSTDVLITTDINETLTHHFEHLVHKVERFLRNGSGWVVEKVKSVNISVTK